MEQRFCVGNAVEVAALIPNDEVEDECSARCDVFAQLLIFICKQRKPAESPNRRQNEQKCGEYAPNAARIEFEKAECVAPQAVEDDGWDQEAWNDEKYIDTDESTADKTGKCVKTHDRENGDCTQAINVGAIFRVR